ncbi:hypothetical protein F4780DRAFT_777015 [Xylariomycetidae sp. FL0641]|nr:hypothetical protein F4780DRAFT_777015 [Xylariomycetidae sp. FL0641]
MTDLLPAIACLDVGSNSTLHCCTPQDLGSAACEAVFAPEPGEQGILDPGCLPANTCNTDEGLLDTCQNTAAIYTSFQQHGALEKNGTGPISRYAACVNVPSISRSLSAGLLPSNYSEAVSQYDLLNASDGALKNITLAVTDCLSSTCKVARNHTDCYQDLCAPTNLLVNNTTPNLAAIDRCLSWLCHSGFAALPYADTDIVGVGVWLSYVLQCVFITVMMLTALLTELNRWRRRKRARIDEDEQKDTYPTETPDPGRSPKKTESMHITAIEEFHKAQCWFMGTLMATSLSYGIYEFDLLVVYMLTPISLNGVLPVVSAYFLLACLKRVPTGISILSTAVYTVSSIVYWSLYVQYVEADDLGTWRVYEQFAYTLSDQRACGGYSALAVCPDSYFNSPKTMRDLDRAGHKIHVLTPLIWTFSTIILLALLFLQYGPPSRRGKGANEKDRERHGRFIKDRILHERPLFTVHGIPILIWRILFILAIAAFLAGLGMQMSLLSIATSLKMMNWSAWSLGQIVAVAVWVPPVLECFYKFGEQKGGPKWRYWTQRRQQRSGTYHTVEHA